MLKLSALALAIASAFGVSAAIDGYAPQLGRATAAESAIQRHLAGDVQAIVPIEPASGLDPRKVDLGRRLFHDQRLSGDQSLSCASCHALERGGVDHRRTPVGMGGAIGGINTPTVYNCALNFRQFWDGRAATLEEQASGPILNPIEMGATWAVVIPRLEADPLYVAGFTASYDHGIEAASITDALAEFERSLSTPGSRFDHFLRGEREAITAEEKAGYALFVSLGCISCHQGMNVGGNLYERFGIMGDYFADRGDLTPADQGRYNVTHRESDRYSFKVPGLRNVALTTPYFHDGSVKTLAKAVILMARYQLGAELSARDTELVVRFLHSLSDPALEQDP
ncbi:MAG: cytochrome-c peroxidase [Planctomycetes bacterium]|nr:cytochrome-c peroxidase [Planctomycetota bacterium]